MSSNKKLFKRTVAVPLDEIISRDREGFLDLLSDLATSTDLLMDIHYRVTGFSVDGQEIFMEITGDDSQVVTMEESI